jgi:hypothetical protein
MVKSKTTLYSVEYGYRTIAGCLPGTHFGRTAPVPTKALGGTERCIRNYPSDAD